jgi:GH25 family lysozyme M1 (1,4-beta-N-acetylmuramidase)
MDEPEPRNGYPGASRPAGHDRPEPARTGLPALRTTGPVTFGWDASNHDWQRGPMDLDAAVADGITFFVHKCTDGDGYYADPYFPAAMTRAQAAAVPIAGAYHVLWNGNVAAQIDWMIQRVNAAAPWWRAPGTVFMWMLDCEPFGYNGSTPTIDTINQAVDLLAVKTGTTPLAYAPHWVYPDVSAVRAPIVASAYGGNPAVHYPDAYPGDGSPRWAAYGKTPAVLQYGSTVTIGSQHTCDINAFRGTPDQFAALTGQEGQAMLDADERKWLQNAYEADWAGGTGMGPPVPDGDRLGDDPALTPVGKRFGNGHNDVLQYVRRLVEELHARPPGEFTDAQVDRIAAVIVAHEDTPLGAADKPVIKAALIEALRALVSQPL